MALTRRHEELIAVGRSLDVSGDAMTNEEYRHAVAKYHRLEKIDARQRKTSERTRVRDVH